MTFKKICINRNKIEITVKNALPRSGGYTMRNKTVKIKGSNFCDCFLN